MSSKLSRDTILRESSISQVEHTLVSAAREFVVLGYFLIAHRLVSLLLIYRPDHVRRSAALRSFWLVWTLYATDSNKSWPPGELARCQSSDQNLPELMKWPMYIHGQKPENYPDNAEGLIKMIDGLDKITAEDTTGGAAMDKSAGLVRALDLRIRLAEEGSESEYDLPGLDEILERISKRLHANQQVEYLMYSTAVLELLRGGKLRRQMGVKEDKVVKLAEDAEKAFKERFEKAAEKYTRSMKELVDAITENTKNNKRAKEFAMERGVDVEQELQILRDPATAVEIERLEHQLGLGLPTDFKEFLKISNGLGRAANGIASDPPLLPLDEIELLKDEDLYNEYPVLEILGNDIDFLRHRVPELLELQWPKRDGVIQIATLDVEDTWIIPPKMMAKLREVYLNILRHEATPEWLKVAVKNAIHSTVGSMDEFERWEWCVIDLLKSVSQQSYPSFHAFMAQKALDSGRVMYGNPENDCFSYACR